MAESIFRQKVQDGNLADEIFIDSAGTGDWHVGELPDPRTIKVLKANGIEQYSRARQVRSADFQEFDYIIAMDAMNVRDLHAWSGADPSRITTMLEWVGSNDPVPDPYYGDASDFEHVYALLDAATSELLVKILENHALVRTK